MITGERARELLHLAAETIDVDSEPPVSEHPNQAGWVRPIAVALAAVVIVVGAGLVTSRLAPHGAGPDPAAPPSRVPVEQPYDAAPDQLPGLLGYPVQEATDDLTALGLRVETRPLKDGCRPPGIVAGVFPGQGATFNPGDVVRLRVTQRTIVDDCMGEPPWEAIYALLQFARGITDNPPLAAGVRLTVDGKHAVDLDATEAQDPGAWTVCTESGMCHSALGALQEVLTRPVTVNGRAAAPSIQINESGPCPLVVMDTGVSVGLELLVGPRPYCGSLPQISLTVSATDVAQITAVDVATAPVRDEQGDPTAAERGAAEQFVAWARDDRADLPPFADEVDVRALDTLVRTLQGDEVFDRMRYGLCPDGARCPDNPSALTILGAYAGSVAYSTTPAGPCVGADRTLPQALEAAASDGRLVRLDEPEPPSCHGAFTIELTFDDEDDITSVNTFPPSG